MTNTELREMADEFIGSVPDTRPGELLFSMMRNVDKLNDFGKAILNLIEENEKLKEENEELVILSKELKDATIKLISDITTAVK